MPITALGFLAVFTIGCLVALKRPFVGLLLYFFVFYMHPPGKYWGAFLPELRWTLIVAVITLISTFINEKDKGVWLKFKETKLLIAFTALVLIQFPFALSFEWHQIYAVLLVKLVILFFLIITLINSEKRLYAAILTNLVLAAYIGYTALGMHSGGRFENAGLPSIEDSNLLAIHMIPIVIMGAFAFLGHTSKSKYWLLLVLAFAGNLILMTGSRGAILALGLTGFWLLIISPKDLRGRLIRYGTLAFVALSFLTIDLIVNRLSMVVKAEDVEQTDKSAYSRIVIIEGQYEMWKESPIFGNGHRTTLIKSPIYIPEEFLTRVGNIAVRGSHNLSFSILTDHGFVGFLLYFSIAWSSYVGLRKIVNDTKYPTQFRLVIFGLIGSIIGVFVASQFSNSKVLEIYFWVIGFSVSAQLIAAKLTQTKEKDN